MALIDISTPKYPNTFAIVDDEDYEWLSKYKWCRTINGYVQRSKKINGVRTIILMHRELMGFPVGDVDHADHDKLNNRKENLRPCSRSENNANRMKQFSVRTTSPFKGVSWDGLLKNWRVQFRARGKKFNVGNFATQEAAAMAYDKVAVEHFGAFARLNFPRGNNELY